MAGSNCGRTLLTFAWKTFILLGQGHLDGRPGLKVLGLVFEDVRQDPDPPEVGDPVELRPLVDSQARRETLRKRTKPVAGDRIWMYSVYWRVRAISSIWRSDIPRCLQRVAGTA